MHLVMLAGWNRASVRYGAALCVVLSAAACARTRRPAETSPTGEGAETSSGTRGTSGAQRSMDGDGPIGGEVTSKDAEPEAPGSQAGSQPDGQVLDAQPMAQGAGEGDDHADEFALCPGRDDLQAIVKTEEGQQELSGGCDPLGTRYPVGATTPLVSADDPRNAVSLLLVACDRDSQAALVLGLESVPGLPEAVANSRAVYIDALGQRRSTPYGATIRFERLPPARQAFQQEPRVDEVWEAAFEVTFDDGTEMTGSVRACSVTFHDQRAFLDSVIKAFSPASGGPLFG